MPVEVKVTEKQWKNEDEAQAPCGAQWEEEMALISRCSHSQKSSATMAQILSKPTFYPSITRRLARIRASSFWVIFTSLPSLMCRFNFTRKTSTLKTIYQTNHWEQHMPTDSNCLAFCLFEFSIIKHSTMPMKHNHCLLEPLNGYTHTPSTHN